MLVGFSALPCPKGVERCGSRAFIPQFEMGKKVGRQGEDGWVLVGVSCFVFRH